MDELLRGFRTSSNRPIAVFLGAGASKTFGYPITRDLMLKIFGGLIKNEILDKEEVGPGVVVDDPRKELLDFLTELLHDAYRIAE